MCISRILAGLSVCLVPFLSVSAEAGVVDKVSFGVEPTVVAELVSQSPGESRYRIVSNSPFRISASNVIGPIKTRISRIGAAAQSPGPHTRCRIKLGALPSVIYKAKRRTAQMPGRLRAQSVIITLRYPKISNPVFRIVPTKPSKRLRLAKRCKPATR